MVKLVNTADLKSVALWLVGSNPTGGTTTLTGIHNLKDSYSEDVYFKTKEDAEEFYTTKFGSHRRIS